MAFTSWLQRLKWAPGRDGRAHHSGHHRRTVTPRRSFVPRLLVLEDRTVPSLLTVTNNLDTGVSGDGSLRGEIAAASQNGDTSNTIYFAPRLSGKTITLTQGELDINLASGRSLDIEGLGAPRLAISGGNTSRVFYISPGTTATIARLTITDGRAETHETVLRSHGGGVLNDTDADLTLRDVLLSHNTAQGILATWAGQTSPSWTGRSIFSARASTTGRSSTWAAATTARW